LRPAGDAGLVRGIREWDLVAYFINAIVGAGIFGLPGRIYALTGVWSVLAYVVCAVLAVLIVLCLAELGSRYSATGGPYLYARDAFGSFAGFEIGWLLWLARLTAFAALCNLFVDYLAWLWPAAGAGAWRALVITGIVVVLTTVSVANVRVAALFGDLFTVGKLVPLVLFVVVGAFFVSPARYEPGPPPAFGDFSTAVLLLAFAFSGFEIPMITAGETLEPRRHVPIALLRALAVVVVLYLSIQVVCIGTLPGLAASQRPLADASAAFLGAAGATIITIGALISVTGTLSSIMLAAPRVLYAMAQGGQLPRLFAATHERLHTPHVAVLVSAALVLVLTLSGSFISALTLSAITRLIVYAVSCAAVPVLRRRPEAPPATFTVRAGAVVAIAALVLCAWLISSSSWSEARNVAVAALVGTGLWFVCGRASGAEPRAAER
jgi:amino acid transporter